MYILTQEGRSFKTLLKEKCAIAFDSCYLQYFLKNVKHGIEHDIDTNYEDMRISLNFLQIC